MNPKLLAISGVKNSGKTTLIEKVIPKLKEKNLKIGTIKHDGHDFEPDVVGTDSYIHRKAGANGVCIFSENRYMFIEERSIDLEEVISRFKDYDLILLEGFKDYNIPKIEIIRKDNSQKPVCPKENVIAYVSDLERVNDLKPIYNIDDIEGIVKFIFSYYKESGFSFER